MISRKFHNHRSVRIQQKFNSFMLILFSFIDIAEHEPSDINIIDSDHQSWQTTTERTLIR